MSLADVIRASAGATRAKTFDEHVQEVEEREREEAAAARAAGGFDEYGDLEEPSPERVTLVPGEGRRGVEMAESVSSQIARLQAWEGQLQAYSDQLTEQGWTTWKSSAVTSVMHELQRKVLPDTWRDEVTRMETQVAELQGAARVAAKKERALLDKIERLESGPGSTKELQSQLEATELQLQQQRQRERQMSVFKELITTGAVSDNAGGAAPSTRRRATIAGGQAKLDVERAAAAHRERAAASPPKPEAAHCVPGGATIDTSPGGVAPLAEVEKLQVALARAQQEVAEAQEEAKAARDAAAERSSGLEVALEAERKAKRHAIEALESLHLCVAKRRMPGFALA
jgi:hypothetical protein